MSGVTLDGRTGGRILVVEDDAVSRTILESSLEDAFEVRAVDSGDHALEVIRDFRPDIVLMDVVMPGINGYETCRRIRANPQLGRPKILMISANTESSERLLGYEAGADDYVGKPFVVEEILAKVRVFLRLKSVEEINKLRNDLLTLLSHETRTPLGALLGSADLLVHDNALSDEERRDFAEIVLNNGRKLVALFEKITLLAQLRAGETRLADGTLDLGAVAVESAHRFRKRAGTRNVTIESQRLGSLKVRGDAELLRRCADAFLDNAIRFSPEGATVVVSARSEDSSVVFSVTDQGQGISAEVMPHLFEPLVVADVGHHSAGNGLSLALTKAIVELHRGQVGAKNAPEGGAHFSFTLPMSQTSD